MSQILWVSVLVFPFVAIREYLTNTGQWMWEVVRHCWDHAIGRRHCQKTEEFFKSSQKFKLQWYSTCSSFDLRIKHWTILRYFVILTWFLWFLHGKMVTWRVPDPCAFLMTFRTRILKWGWTWKRWSPEKHHKISTLIEHNLQAVFSNAGWLVHFPYPMGSMGMVYIYLYTFAIRIK